VYGMGRLKETVAARGSWGFRRCLPLARERSRGRSPGDWICRDEIHSRLTPTKPDDSLKPSVFPPTNPENLSLFS
jgi:hypothetical protein